MTYSINIKLPESISVNHIRQKLLEFSGEGGVLLVNEQKYALRAEIIREKGTDRSQFLRGEVDKYTWQDARSSYLPAEIIAALLWSQLENARQITEARSELWDRYHDLSKTLEDQARLRRPYVPEDCQHNGHLYYVLVLFWRKGMKRLLR